MKMELGSWRDPAIARDATFLGGLGLLVWLAVAVPSELVWVIAGAIILGALLALAMLVRYGRAPSLGEATTPVPHPGPNASRISPAGLPGLVFAVGFVCMFWFGLPPFRPVVAGLAVAGVVAGFVLVGFEKRHRVPTSTPLGLSGSGSSPEGNAEGRLDRQAPIV